MSTTLASPPAPPLGPQLREFAVALGRALKRRLCILRGGHQFTFYILRRENRVHRTMRCRTCGCITPYREPVR